MAVAVKIPGPGSVGQIGVTRDPGVRADPEAFGAGIGRALADFGETMGAVSAKFAKDREGEEDSVALDAADLEYTPRARQAYEDWKRAIPAGAEGADEDLTKRLTKAEADTRVALQQRGLALSRKGELRFKSRVSDIQRQHRESGVGFASNERVRHLSDETRKNVDALAAEALAGGDETAIDRVDDLLKDKERLFGPAEFATVRDTARKKVANALIERYDAAGDREKARQLRDRFFGGVPDEGRQRRLLPTSTSDVLSEAATNADLSPDMLNLVERVVAIESGGNPNAVSGSYKGLFQLSEEEFFRYGGGNIFDARDNAKAGINALKARIGEFRVIHGREPTATEIYLAHQQGQGGLREHLRNPDRPAWENMHATAEGQNKGERWARAAIWGNIPDDVKKQFPGGVESVTSEQFMAVWQRKVEGRALPIGQSVIPDPEAAIAWEKRFRAGEKADETEAARSRLDGQSQRAEDWDLQITNAASGNGILPSRSAIETDEGISPTQRNVLLRQYDAAVKRDGDLEFFKAASSQVGFTWNPFDEKHRDANDAGFKLMGGDLPALQKSVDTTGIVPRPAASLIRAAIVSNDMKRVVGAMTVANNLMTRNPAIFSGLDGASEIEKAAVSFGHYVDLRGTSAEEAAQRIIQQQTPEYRAKVATAIRTGDIDKVVKDNLKVDDLRSAFDESWWWLSGQPEVGFTPEARNGMFSDYAELFKESYLETGDIALSKTQAIAQLKKVWGVSKLQGTGDGVVMRFPPEMAPVYAGIPDVSKRIADDAVQSIKAEMGAEVARDKLILAPLLSGQTSQPYVTGKPVPYILSWRDKNDVLHTAQRPFVADPAAMRAAISEERRKGLEEAQKRVEQVTAPGQPGDYVEPGAPPSMFGPGQAPAPVPEGNYPSLTFEEEQMAKASPAPPAPATAPAGPSQPPGPAREGWAWRQTPSGAWQEVKPEPTTPPRAGYVWEQLANGSWKEVVQREDVVQRADVEQRADIVIPKAGGVGNRAARKQKLN